MPPLEVAMATKAKSAGDIRKEIELRAYLIWESEGCPHGCDGEHWARAEAEILGVKPAKKARVRKSTKAAATKPKKPAKATTKKS
jgi:hypothetical protein